MVPRACIAIQLYTAIQRARIQLRYTVKYTAYALYSPIRPPSELYLVVYVYEM